MHLPPFARLAPGNRHGRVCTEAHRACVCLIQDGGSKWIRLRSGMYRPISAPPVRLCGTPGCTLPDWHVGCHSTERRLPPRLTQQPTLPPPHHPPRRSPRLSPRRFRWDDFHIDIQASVLLHLSAEPKELLIHLARLACHIRPFRDAIQHALSIHAGLRDMLSDGWKACSTKFDREMNDLSCSWCRACRSCALPAAS